MSALLDFLRRHFKPAGQLAAVATLERQPRPDSEGLSPDAFRRDVPMVECPVKSDSSRKPSDPGNEPSEYNFP
jgi:hypothetical protein